jgi:hypothetical protein
MNDRSTLEGRIAALIGAYADAAPTDVDAVAMTRFASEAGAQRSAWVPGRQDRGLVLVLVALALIVALLAGAIAVGGRPSRWDRRTLLTERALVQPFVGLPPDDATPSKPETGDLVLSLGGRVERFGGDFFRLWLYADGRLIWTSNLEGSNEGWSALFGSTEPTRSVIEQWLTPKGVDLMRAEVAAKTKVLGRYEGSYVPFAGPRPGLLLGAMTMADGDALFEVTWTDPALPGRLVEPASWLPPDAWADSRVGAYVASRYSLCATTEDETGTAIGADAVDRLPLLVRTLIVGADAPAATAVAADDGCHDVPTDVARSIAAALEAGGYRVDRSNVELWYTGSYDPVRRLHIRVALKPVLPHGEEVCDCG